MTLFWGQLEPDAAGASRFWGPNYPDHPSTTGGIVGTGPAGAYSFALSLESGAQLTWTWLTDVFKAYDGTEQRTAVIDAPKPAITGSALLIGAATRATRAAIARFAAIGSPFSLGLQYEAVALAGLPDGLVLPVTSTTSLDWCALGQRVIVQLGDAFITAVIQDFTDTSITIDTDPTPVAEFGAVIMPAAAIYLQPTQAFARYPTPDGVESWAIEAAIVPFNFDNQGRSASVLFAGHSTALALAGLAWATIGTIGNTKTIAFVADGGGTLQHVSNVADAYTLHFTSGTTTVAQAVTLLESAGFDVLGTFTPTTTLTATIDEFAALALTRGTDPSVGTWGRGATLATHATIPVWDRPIEVDDTASDSVQAMNEIIDMDGVLANVGSALIPDWGRQVQYGHELGAEWQWLKLFLYTARGCQRTWWLPTWRADLVAVSHTASTITIEGPSVESGDFFAFYPAQRQQLQVQQADGTITYLTITGATDNGDGTITLTVEVQGTPTPASAAMSGPTFGGCTLQWAVGGAAGNGMDLEMIGVDVDAFPFTHDQINQVSTQEWDVTYRYGSTPAVAANIVTLIESAGFQVIGSYNPAAGLQAGDSAGYLLSGGTDPSAAATLSTVVIEAISWLELCHFESDDFQITFDVGTFSFSQQGRVVQQ